MNALKQIGQNLLIMALNKTVILWALRLAAKQTDNKIDDNVIEVVDAAYEADTERLKSSVENIVKELNNDDV